MSIQSILKPALRDDWETPQWLFDLVQAEFALELDVCATNETAKCEHYIDAEQDAFKTPWTFKRCWMNPPYGRGLEQWMQLAWDYSKRGHLVVCLVPASTENEWWWRIVEASKAEVRFIRGRVNFVGTTSGSTFGSALVIFRQRWWTERSCRPQKTCSQKRKPVDS